MEFEIYIPDAMEMVASWEIAPEDFPQAVNDQARLMAGQGLEPSLDNAMPSPYAALRF